MSVDSHNGEPNPQLVWDTMNAYQKTAALRAGIHFNLFTLIANGARTVAEIASRSGASPRGVRILCDYLVVIGFLQKRGSNYNLTPTSSAFLNANSPACMAKMVNFLNAPKLMAGFADFAETVRKGTTQIDKGGVIEPEFSDWTTFAESMTPLMASASQLIAEECCRMSGSLLRVLDVAAGHGLFGISVARRIPEAKITAQDWPDVLEIAERNAKSASVEDRYHLLPGDILEMDLREEYDVVLVANFLHHFDQAACIRLLTKLHRSLTPGGRIILLDFIPNDDRVTPPIPASFALMMLGVTPAGDTYTARQFDDMLTSAGFDRPSVVPVPQSPQHLVISEKSAQN